MTGWIKTANVKLRDFTKNDYYGFAGAEKPSEDQDPMIAYTKLAEGGDCAVVVDKNTIEVVSSDTQWSLAKDVAFKEGKNIAESLSDPIKISQLLELGFERSI